MFVGDIADIRSIEVFVLERHVDSWRAVLAWVVVLVWRARMYRFCVCRHVVPCCEDSAPVDNWIES